MVAYHATKMRELKNGVVPRITHVTVKASPDDTVAKFHLLCDTKFPYEYNRKIRQFKQHFKQGS